MTDAATPAKIVVGVNGSRSSLRALTWAHRQARLTHGQLHIVISTWTVPVPRGGVPVPEGSDLPVPAPKALDEAIDDTLGSTGTDQIRREVVPGHPARALLDAASDADLLVVGSGGPGSTGTATSALCQDLVSRAPCPVVVVRGEPELIAPTRPSAAVPAADGEPPATAGEGHRT